MRKATEEEEGINWLQGEIQSRIAALRRAKNLLRKDRILKTLFTMEKISASLCLWAC